MVEVDHGSRCRPLEAPLLPLRLQGSAEVIEGLRDQLQGSFADRLAFESVPEEISRCLPGCSLCCFAKPQQAFALHSSGILAGGRIAISCAQRLLADGILAKRVVQCNTRRKAVVGTRVRIAVRGNGDSD